MGFVAPGEKKKQIHSGSIRNNVVLDLTLIKTTVARFVGTGSFLVRYFDDDTKQNIVD